MYPCNQGYTFAIRSLDVIIIIKLDMSKILTISVNEPSLIYGYYHMEALEKYEADIISYRLKISNIHFVISNCHLEIIRELRI